MKKAYNFSIVILIWLAFACHKKEEVKIRTIDYVFTCDLIDDAAAQAAYEKYHSQEEVWPEVLNACEVSGVTELKVFKQGRRLMLLITLPENITLADFDEKYNGSDPRMQEWASLMGGFQTSPPGAKPNQVWVPMKTVFNYDRYQ